MNFQKPPLRRALLAAGAVIGSVCATVGFAAPADAAPTITFTRGVLTINGDAGDNSLVVGRTAAGTVTLNGTAVLGATVPVANVLVVRMDGAAGNDTLRLDETHGPMPPGVFGGGLGRDSLVGGSKADSLVGGAGIDRIIGGPGDDTVSMGEDSDQFTWNPGDGNDHVDGDAGKDSLMFNGSDRTASGGLEREEFSFASNGARTTIRRDLVRSPPGFSEVNIMSFSGFEVVNAPMASGPNRVFFGDNFSISDVGLVRVNLGPPIDPTQTLGGVNSANFFSPTEGADRIRIGGTPATGATVTGLGPAVVSTGAQELSVFGKGGDDVIDAGLMAPGTVGRLTESGGTDDEPGNDTLIGHPGNDLLLGGGGDDRLEGRGGNDSLNGGPGNNIIIP